MLDQTTAQADTRTPVAREFLGKARDLRRRVDREDAVYLRTINDIVAPVRERLTKFPHRKPRPETIAAMVQQWRLMEPRDYRTFIEASLGRTRCALLERRAVAGQMRFLQADWTDDEPDIGICEVSVLLDGNRLRVHTRLVCTFSLHALSRRYQRHSDSHDAAILHDMEVVARIAPASIDSPGGFKITTHPDGGGWRGRTIKVEDNGGNPDRIISVRTWLES